MYVFRTIIFAIISLNSVNQLIFVMVKCGVFFAVRTEFLSIMLLNFGFKGLNCTNMYRYVCAVLRKPDGGKVPSYAAPYRVFQLVLHLVLMHPASRWLNKWSCVVIASVD
jgi:hypothetical protein